MSFLLGLLIPLFFGYFIWRLFTSKWQEVFITQDVEEYMSISGALQAARVRYRSTTGGQEFNSRRNSKSDHIPSISYSIFVQDTKLSQAQQIINEIKYGL